MDTEAEDPIVGTRAVVMEVVILEDSMVAILAVDTMPEDTMVDTEVGIMVGIMGDTTAGIIEGTMVGVTTGVITHIGDYGDGDYGDGLFWDGPMLVGPITATEDTRI